MPLHPDPFFPDPIFLTPFSHGAPPRTERRRRRGAGRVGRRGWIGRWLWRLLRRWMVHSFCVFCFMSIDRKRSRAAVNRTQAGIRSRRRRPWAGTPPRAAGRPLHEGSSDAQSAKTGTCGPTAAHGLSAARFPKEWFSSSLKKHLQHGSALCRSSNTHPHTLSEPGLNVAVAIMASRGPGR